MQITTLYQLPLAVETVLQDSSYYALSNNITSLVVPNDALLLFSRKVILATFLMLSALNKGDYMAIIKVDNLTFAYPYTYENIFTNTSFVLDTDWKLGFVGRNGKGKTTFLKLLLNQYPYNGSIITSTPFDYFPYNVKDKSALVVDILAEITNDAPQWRLQKELSFLKLNSDILWRSFDSLSNGEQTKVLLAGFFVKDGYFHLIDEPTNHLDGQSRQLVANYLKGKKGFILVSHDRTFLDSCVDHILSLNRQSIEVIKGNYSTFKQNFDNRIAYEQTQNDTLKKQIDKLEQSVKRTRQWADSIEREKTGNGPCDRGYIGHLSERMMQRAKAVEHRRQRAIEQKSALLNDIERCPTLKIGSVPYHNNTLLVLDNVSVTYGNRQVCSGIGFKLNNYDRIALDGANGSGKTSIIKLLLGQDISYTGSLQIGKGITISYIPQDASFLSGSLVDYATTQKVDITLFLTILRKLDFERSQFDKPMDSYSMGQKKKVLLAISLCQQANLYIWDEPLNYLDIYSRLQVEELLLNNPSTMIFVEHDATFRQKIATKVVKL